MRFLKYFFYLAWHWNIRLAFFIVKNEIKGEKKYGIITTGIDDLKATIPQQVLAHASIYQPINYFIAETLFDQITYQDLQAGLLDLGCGKGRALAIAAAYGFKQIFGVDFSPALCDEAEITSASIAGKNKQAHIEIICIDAANYIIPATVSTIFLFNPFDDLIMREVIKQIKKSQALHQRSIKILYANPVCKALFFEAGFIETFYLKKLEYLECAVLEQI